jgi:hypothetical protein
MMKYKKTGVVAHDKSQNINAPTITTNQHFYHPILSTHFTETFYQPQLYQTTQQVSAYSQPFLHPLLRG